MKRLSLSDEDILCRLRGGMLRVDVETAQVWSRKRKKSGGLMPEEVLLAARPANPRANRSREKKAYLFVSIKAGIDGAVLRKNVPLHKLVWMAKNDRAVPAGSEIHHGEEGPECNAWWNLACMTKEEHDDIHGRTSTKSEDWI